MTREEFHAIGTYWELKDFCYDESLSDMDDYYDEDGIDGELNYWLRDCCTDDWMTVRDTLNDVPTGYDYYRYVGGGEVYGYYDGDDNFRALKDDIRSYLEDTGYWDEPDDDDDDDYIFASLPPEHVRSPFSHGSVGEATVDFDTTVNILSAIA